MQGTRKGLDNRARRRVTNQRHSTRSSDCVVSSKPQGSRGMATMARKAMATRVTSTTDDRLATVAEPTATASNQVRARKMVSNGIGPLTSSHRPAPASAVATAPHSAPILGFAMTAGRAVTTDTAVAEPMAPSGVTSIPATTPLELADKISLHRLTPPAIRQTRSAPLSSTCAS